MTVKERGTPPSGMLEPMDERAGYGSVRPGRTVPANREWWDAEADAYYAEHGAFLGDDDFRWCPEGLLESQAHLLGDPDRLAGADVLEVGCGAAQCSRWLAGRGARVTGLDLSGGMLRRARVVDRRLGVVTPLVQADAGRLPFADSTFDLACSAFGAVPFVDEPGAVHSEVARVLRPGGRWVFAVGHPVRWAFPDDPGHGGLTVHRSYFDRTPYRELDADGDVTYVEHHRTLGDRVREIVSAGLVLDDLVEPEWTAGMSHVWGGWSPLRGRLLPGTAIFVTHRPG